MLLASLRWHLSPVLPKPSLVDHEVRAESTKDKAEMQRLEVEDQAIKWFTTHLGGGA